MKKECTPVMGFRHSHIGINFTSNIYIYIYIYVRTRFVTTPNSVGFVRKKAQTISFVERGFERLGLGYQTVVFRGIHT